MSNDNREHSDAEVRWRAAISDREAGRDLGWARTDPDAAVRLVAAHADSEAGRDLGWARTDSDGLVRWAAAVSGTRWERYRLGAQRGGSPTGDVTDPRDGGGA